MTPGLSRARVSKDCRRGLFPGPGFSKLLREAQGETGDLSRCFKFRPQLRLGHRREEAQGLPVALKSCWLERPLPGLQTEDPRSLWLP